MAPATFAPEGAATPMSLTIPILTLPPFIPEEVEEEEEDEYYINLPEMVPPQPPTIGDVNIGNKYPGGVVSGDELGVVTSTANHERLPFSDMFETYDSNPSLLLPAAGERGRGGVLGGGGGVGGRGGLGVSGSSVVAGNGRPSSVGLGVSSNNGSATLNNIATAVNSSIMGFLDHEPVSDPTTTNCTDTVLVNCSLLLPSFPDNVSVPTTTDYAEMGKDYWSLILLLFPIFTVLGNMLVIVSVFRERSLQTVTNYFIVSLAVADLLLAACVMPFAVYYLVNVNWGLGVATCDFYFSMDVFCSTSSIFNLVAICIDRYMAVTKPIKYAQHKNNKRIVLTIMVVWVVSAAIGSPMALGLNNKMQRDETVCEFVDPDFIIYSSLSSFYIPCLIMIYLYYKIFKVIRRRAKNAPNSKRPKFTETKGGTVIENVAQTKKLAETTLGPAVAPPPKTVVHTTIEEDKPTNNTSNSQEEEEDDDCHIIANTNTTDLILTPLNDHSRETSTRNGAAADSSQPSCPASQALLPSAKRVKIQSKRNGSARPPSRKKDDIEGGTAAGSSPASGGGSSSGGVGVGNDDVSKAGGASVGGAAGGMSVSGASGAGGASSGGGGGSTTTGGGEGGRGGRGGASGTGGKGSERGTKAGLLDKKDKRAGGPRFTIYKVNKASKKKREKSSAKKERKATKTLAIVLGAFLACWVPFFTCNILDAIGKKMSIDSLQSSLTTFMLTTWLGYMNSCLNPVIYTIFNPEFRKAFKKIITCAS